MEPVLNFSCRGFFLNIKQKQRKKQMIFAKATERAMAYFEMRRSKNFGGAECGKLTTFEVVLTFARIS